MFTSSQVPARQPPILLKGPSLNQPLCETLPIEIRETALRLSAHHPYNTSIREVDPRNYLTQRLHAPKFSWLSLSNSSDPAVNLNRKSLYLNDFPSLLCRLRICLLTNQTDKVYCIITSIVILCTPYRRSSTLRLVEHRMAIRRHQRCFSSLPNLLPQPWSVHLDKRKARTNKEWNRTVLRG